MKQPINPKFNFEELLNIEEWARKLKARLEFWNFWGRGFRGTRILAIVTSITAKFDAEREKYGLPLFGPRRKTCKQCKQEADGQTGEYPCLTCGLPQTHDDSCKCYICKREKKESK